MRRPPQSTRTDTLLPYTTLFRSGDELGHRGLGQAGQTRILYGSGMEGELTRRLEPGGKVGKAEADRLMPDNGFPHRVAVLGIGDRDLKGRLRHADRLRSNADAADLEVGESSDERRVGDECVSKCKYRWSPEH